VSWFLGDPARITVPPARGGGFLSVGAATVGGMQITVERVERIPAGNLRVRLTDFVTMWVAAEGVCDWHAQRREIHWYAAGVCATCRWLAATPLPSPRGRDELWPAPYTGRAGAAYGDLIEHESVLAETDLMHNEAGWPGRPGYLEGIVATLLWVLDESDVPPIPIDRPAPA
jgi:hypothetical protein